MSAGERLTSLDAGFLDAERPEAPLHIGALCIFDGEPFYDEDGEFRLEVVRERVAERLHLFPRFRQRVLDVPLGLDRPIWVEDPDFDIAHHVRLAVLPPPGDRRQLEARCEQLQMQPIDRARPLWELWFIGGLEDGSVALVEKVHHAMIDGVSGVEVAAALFDFEPAPPPIEVPEWDPPPMPNDLERLVGAARHVAGEPLALAGAALEAVRRPAELVGNAVQVLRLGADLLLPGNWAPTTSLDRTIGDRRRLLGVTEPLADLKEAAHRVGAKVNDVVLAGVTGGLRRLLEHRGEHPDDLTIRVLVPVSIRTEKQHLTMGNEVAAMLAPLPVHVPTPAGRLAATRDVLAGLKDRHQAEGTVLARDAAEHLPPGITGLLARNLHHQRFVNIVVTNIPGPPVPLYFMGAQLRELIPVVPLGGNLTVNVAVLSYDGSITLGIHADPDACPEVEQLAGWIRAELDALIALDPDEVPPA